MSHNQVDRIRMVSPPPWCTSSLGVLLFLTAILDVPAQDNHHRDDPALGALERIGATVRRIEPKAGKLDGPCSFAGTGSTTGA